MVTEAGPAHLVPVVDEAVLPGGTASAQQVRATSSGVEVRLDPSDSSPVIATLEEGAVLEWIGESGPYYAVSIPGPPGQDNLVGYVLASQVETVAAGDPAVTGAPPPPTTAPAAMSIPGLQAQYNRAQQQRADGQKRAIQGAGLAIAAQATFSITAHFEVEDREQYPSQEAYDDAVSRNSAATSVKDGAIMAGAALAAYGIATYVLGWRTMENLALDLPAQAEPALQEQYAEANGKVRSGRSKVIGGAALVAGSYATLNFVPWLGVPEPGDFDTSADYLSAVDRRNTAETFGSWFTAAGAVVAVWGGTQWFLGARKMAEIEDTAAQTTAMAHPRGLRDVLAEPRLHVGRKHGRTEFALNWAW